MNHYYYYAEHLILDGNELTGSIPQELEDLTKLGMLYILRCTKPIIPETVDGMNFNWTDAKQKTYLFYPLFIAIGFSSVHSIYLYSDLAPSTKQSRE
jgi:hypothetical protein